MSIVSALMIVCRAVVAMWIRANNGLVDGIFDTTYYHGHDPFRLLALYWHGLEIGTSLYDAMDPASASSDVDTCRGTMPHWLKVALFPLVGISLAMALGATVCKWPSMFCPSAIRFGISTIVSKVIANRQMIGAVSAFSVGLFGPTCI